MSIKLNRNRAVGGSSSVRASTTVRNEGQKMAGATSESIAEGVKAFGVVKNKQAEATGGDKYLQWNQEATKKYAELSNLYGSDAEGLVNSFDEWNNEYVGNLEFGDNVEQNSFFDSHRGSNATYRKNLAVSQVDRAFEYNNDVLDNKIEQDIKNGTLAIASGDESGVANMAQGYANYKKRFPGIDDKLLTENYQTLVKQTTGSLSQNKVNNGDVYGGFNDIRSLTDAGVYDEFDEANFYQTNMKAMAKSEVEVRLRAAMKDNTYYTKQEIAELNGVDTSNWTRMQKTELSSSKRSQVEVLSKANEMLNNDVYANKTYYEGNQVFNDMVNNGVGESVQKMMSTEVKVYKDNISAIQDNITNEINKWKLNPTDVGLAKISGSITKLENTTGEFTVGAELRKILTESVSTDISKYTKAYADVAAGRFESNYEIGLLSGLNSRDITALKAFNVKKEEPNFKASLESLDKFVRIQLGVEDKKDFEKMTQNQVIQYEKTKATMLEQFVASYDGSLTPTENIKAIAISSAKANPLLEEGVDQFLNESLYDPKNKVNKKFRKAFGLTKEQFTNMARDTALTYGTEDQEVMLETMKINIEKSELDALLGESADRDGKSSISPLDPNYLIRAQTNSAIKEYRDNINWYKEVKKHGL